MATVKTAMTEAFATSMNEIVTYILEVSEYDTTDENARRKLTNAISSAIRMSKARGGHVGTPEQTEIMKIARILHDAKTWDECESRLDKALSKYNPKFNLNRFGWLEWKPKNFVFPEGIIDPNSQGRLLGKKRKRIPKDVVVTKYETPTLTSTAVEEPETLALKAVYDEVSHLQMELAEYKELFWALANNQLVQRDGAWFKLTPIATNGGQPK